jgi:ketol-acid reductoisomerase
MVPESGKDVMRGVLGEIVNGEFARELDDAEHQKRPGVEDYLQQYGEHALFSSERRVLNLDD